MSSDAIKSSPVPSWQKEYERTAKEIEACQTDILRKERKPVPVLRVNQLDAIRLDGEINNILSTQFLKIFAFFKPEAIDKIKPELIALLDLFIYKLSIYSMDTTYGNKLQNLKFTTSDNKPITAWQKILLGVLTIGGRWAWTRANSLSSDRSNWTSEWYAKLWKVLSTLEKVYLCASVINFMVFLYDGKYVSLITRLLSMRLMYRAPSMQRQLSFEFMNQQLVWHEFTEFLMFVMPLINMDKIRSFTSRLFFVAKKKDAVPLSACPICLKDPVQTPYVSNCEHIFCYYCLKQNCMVDSSFSCPRCGSIITSMARYQPDEAEE
eukprot:TRINITY_DN7474_c0_g1_i1.p1 TRINITY_DN7474_c0_g1~~TRINITY_DN7474_c0_g1_i1.p1  ORF type:complete len:322 (-),score=35.84 TRINITY_DN7474_c0_g1_i1:569-1534(-)